MAPPHRPIHRAKLGTRRSRPSVRRPAQIRFSCVRIVRATPRRDCARRARERHFTVSVNFGLNGCKGLLNGQFPTRRKRCHRIEPSIILQHWSRRSPGAADRRVRRARAGQDLRSQALALGAADASAAEGDGGMGRIGREGLERHHQVQDLPVAAARQGVRPLRHGARRHRRLHLRQSRLPARPLPDHRRRRTAVPGRRRQGRHPRDRRLVSQIRGDRDEGREVLLLLHPRSADLAFEARRRSWCRATSRA